MPLNKEEAWADLRYALDELERPLRDFHSLFDSQLDDELSEGLAQSGLLSQPLAMTYRMAKSRADTRIAHEAIEKGLKAILIDGGLPETKVRSRGHGLHRLLADVQQHTPVAFNELERCFESTGQYLESLTPYRYDMGIIAYFQEHGRAEILVANRYASIEGFSGDKYGMVGLVYRETIRALLSLIFGWTPKDIGSRVEEEVTNAVLAESRLDPAWDVSEWLAQGPVRPRLEAIENLESNKVLRAAVRGCARESKDGAAQSWAERLRRKRIAAKRKVRDERRAGRDCA